MVSSPCKMMLLLLLATVNLAVSTDSDNAGPLSEYVNGNALHKKRESGNGDSSGSVNYLILQELFSIKRELRTSEEDLLDKISQLETSVKTHDEQLGKLEEQLKLALNSNEKLVEEIALLSSSEEAQTQQMKMLITDVKVLKSSDEVINRKTEGVITDLEGMNSSEEVQKEQMESMMSELKELKAFDGVQKEQMKSVMSELKELNAFEGVQSKQFENMTTELISLDSSDEALHQQIKDVATELKAMSDEDATKDKYIVGEICTSRSVDLPQGCTTGECCLKHMAESFDKCLSRCSEKCPSGYSSYSEGRFCYKFHRTCATWDEARTSCKDERADLIMLKDSDTTTHFQELSKLEAQYGGCSSNAHWVGATDKSKDGVWTWVDGSVADLSRFWGPGEPNGGSSENCLHLVASKAYNYNDMPCSNRDYSTYICAIQ